VGQHHNARALADRGAGRILEERHIASLPGVLGGLLADEPGRAAMAAAAGVLGRPGAAAVIADRVVEAARD
jgi:UDP-N-acetylglucosamine:LPS N-acetylglucosamine transferase